MAKSSTQSVLPLPSAMTFVSDRRNESENGEFPVTLNDQLRMAQLPDPRRRSCHSLRVRLSAPSPYTVLQRRSSTTGMSQRERPQARHPLPSGIRSPTAWEHSIQRTALSISARNILSPTLHARLAPWRKGGVSTRLPLPQALDKEAVAPPWRILSHWGPGSRTSSAGASSPSSVAVNDLSCFSSLTQPKRTSRHPAPLSTRNSPLLLIHTRTYQQTLKTRQRDGSRREQLGFSSKDLV